MEEQLPRISIITPSYNQGKFLEQTILSVLNQNYPNLEYIVIDGGSSDNSVEIIKKYENYLTYWVSEKDKGMYDALNKGFSKSTGNILTWINSDDLLANHVLFTIQEVFEEYSQIEWVTGQNAYIDEKGRNVGVAGSKKWSKLDYLLRRFRWIQQEGTFWRRSLWEKAGSYINTNYKLASDLELWSRFFNVAELYSIEAVTGYFRMRSQNQKTQEQMECYLEEAECIIKNMPKTSEDIDFMEKYTHSPFLSRMPFFWRLFPYTKPPINYPPSLKFNSIQQKFLLAE